MKISKLFLAALILVPVYADVEDRSTDSRTFPNAQLLILDNVNGSIEATGYNGNDIRMEVSKRISAESQERLEAARREVKLEVQQSGDTLKLYVDGPFRNNNWQHQGYSVQYDFKLQVPRNARLDLYTVNHGQVAVHDVGGDFDIRNVNGGIELTGMGGSGRAHTVNGPVKVTYARNPMRSCSFETVNGAVDLTFRRGLSAKVNMKTMHGGMYTDYDVTSLPVEAATSEKRDGRFVYRHGGATAVRIGSGAIELDIKTINGEIFVKNGDDHK